MRLDYEMTDADLRACYRHYLGRSALLKKVRRRSRLVAVTAASLPFVRLAMQQRWRLAIIGEAVVLVVFAVLAWSLQAIAHRTILRELATRGSVRGHHTLTTLPDGLLHQTQLLETKHRWTARTTVERIPEYLVVSFVAGGAFYIPLRAFESPSSLDAFVREIATHVQGAPALD